MANADGYVYPNSSGASAQPLFYLQLFKEAFIASERLTSSADMLKALAPNTVVRAVESKLRNFDSVRQAAADIEQVAASYDGLDVICCNALS